MARALAWGEPLYTLIYVVADHLCSRSSTSASFSIRPSSPTTCASTAASFPGFGRAATLPSISIAFCARLTLVGGVYLAAVCLLPEWMIAGIHLQHLPGVVGTWFDNHMWRFVLEGLEHHVLLWRHLAADRGWRGDGYRAADRSAVGDAELRRVR